MTKRSGKYLSESASVENLLRALPVTGYLLSDPNLARETGADVLVSVSARKIGVQVRELHSDDLGDGSRLRRAAEVRAKQGQPLAAGWVTLNPAAALQQAVARKLERANKHQDSLRQFDEAWLLIVSGIPSPTEVVATYVSPVALTESFLNSSIPIASDCQYSRIFLFQSVDTFLYEWTHLQGWRNLIQPSTNPNVLREIRENPEKYRGLFADPVAWAREGALRDINEIRSLKSPKAK